jgi:transposase-like protein
MAWKERSRMDKRLVLVGKYLKGEKPMTELCLEDGVSRKTGYKWVGRYNEGRPSALEDRSRAPLSDPVRVDPIVLEALVQARRANPHWGGAKDPSLAERQAARVRPAGCQHRQRDVCPLRPLALTAGASANATLHRPVW